MKPSRSRGGREAGRSAQGPSQRQLRAGELVRHALSEILVEEEISDPALAGVSVTVTEVRMSPDLRHATAFVEPLGAGIAGGAGAGEVVEALNRAARFLRGRLGRSVDLKFTPDLHFRHDESFDAAAHMNALFASPEVARDLSPLPLEGGEVGSGGGRGDDDRHAGEAPPAAADQRPAATPVAGPSPIEGEGG